jgi:hypothetical protein
MRWTNTGDKGDPPPRGRFIEGHLFLPATGIKRKSAGAHTGMPAGGHPTSGRTGRVRKPTVHRALSAAAVCVRGTASDIYLISLDGSALTKITHGAQHCR